MRVKCLCVFESGVCVCESGVCVSECESEVCECVCRKPCNVFIMISAESSRFNCHVIIPLRLSALSSKIKVLPFLHKLHLTVVRITPRPNPYHFHNLVHYLGSVGL